MNIGAKLAQTEEFSLVVGGPLYRLLLRSKLIKAPLGRLGWRIAVVTALAWLPLVPLTIMDGRFNGGVRIPFVYDFEVHSRLLLSLPLLIIAEVIVHVRMRTIVHQFLERQIIPENSRVVFDEAVAQAIRLRNSVAIEIALICFVIFAGNNFWRQTVALHSDSWYASVSGSGWSSTPAGHWYAFVSVPVFQTILFRWYFRIFVWCRFLVQVSRMDLNLVPTHPDRSCGLGFLGTVVFAFAPLLIAHSALAAGYVANRVVHEGVTLPSFKVELVAVVVLLILLTLGPLCVFSPKLNRARIAGLRIYGKLASDYVVGFARKWTGSSAPEGESLVGSADIQSLADLDSSFAIVSEMRLAPFGKDAVIRLIIIIVLPLAPLALTMFSLEELLRRLVAILL